MATEQSYLWTGSIAGRSFKFDGMSGLGKGATLSKFRPGGLGDEVVQRGPGSFPDVTVMKHYDVNNIQEDLRFLITSEQAGVADMHVTEQPLDPTTKNPQGKPIVAKGVFQSVDLGTGDSTSGATRMVTFTMSVESIA